MHSGVNEPSQIEHLIIGEDAGPDNPLESGVYCFNISSEADIFKEGVETFTLSLQSNDECVWLGRDVATVTVQANGGDHA